METIPARLREPAFRRFENVIGAIVDSWPEPICFDAVPLSVETFSARLRDAMRSYHENNWESTLVAREKFCSIYDGICVRMISGRVTVGPRSKGPQILHNPSLSLAESHPSAMSPTKDELEVFARMLSEGLLVGPLIIYNVDEPLLLELESKYNVSFAKQGDHYILL